MGKATEISITKFAEGAKSLLKDERFSDFTIICKGKELKVYRSIIAAHSKWFEKCCSGGFLEADNQRTELKEDPLLAVEAMIEFFYNFDYYDRVDANLSTSDSIIALGIDAPSAKRRRGDSGRSFTLDSAEASSVNSMKLNAWVYVTADKYDVPGRKMLAFEKFKDFLGKCHDQDRCMTEAVLALYNELPDTSVVHLLRQTLVDAWLVAGQVLMQVLNDDLNMDMMRGPLDSLLI